MLVAPDWVITAAHCFSEIYTSNPEPKGSVFFSEPQWQASFGPEDVFLAPDAVPEAEAATDRFGSLPLTYFQTFPLGADQVRAAYDLALVRLPRPAQGHSPAKLWHPAAIGDRDSDLRTPSLIDSVLTFAGKNGTGQTVIDDTIPDTFAAPGTGTSGSRVLVSIRGRGRSQLEPGDSGGGAFVHVTEPSQPFGSSCAVTPGGPGEVLVGINAGFSDTYDTWAPVYRPHIVEWIARVTARDRDGDGICDEVDNCPSEPNPDQANCNYEAEEAWGNGIHLGDACDPAPCPDPALHVRRFERGATIPRCRSLGNDALVCEQSGRDIADIVSITPILEKGRGGISDNDIRSKATTRFCDCRDDDGNPVRDLKACLERPHFCEFDPRQADSSYREIGGDERPVPSVTARTTYWRSMSMNSQPRGSQFDITYPGRALSLSWNYRADYNHWLAQGFIGPAKIDPRYPAGTDLYGILWAHDGTNAGTEAHGLGWYDPGDEIAISSIADGYALGVAPDLKSFSATMRRVPVLRPAPPWAYCAVCGDGMFRFPNDWATNPAPFVSVLPNLETVVWSSQGGGRLLTSSLSQNLRQSLLDSSAVWVPASEPVSMTNDPSLPTAVLLSRDGTRIVDAIARGDAGFELAIADRRNTDKGLAGTMAVTFGDQPSPRAGFAAAWSRTASALYVIGGRDPNTGAPRNDAWSFDTNGVWRSVPVDSMHAPRDVRAAVFSVHDWRVWILDRRPPAFPLFGSGWRLLRIDPATGIVDTDIPLPALALFEDVYLTTMEDGKVALVATGGEAHAVAFLTTTRVHGKSRVRFVGARFGLGRVMGQPIVRHGLISLPLRKRSLFGLEESIVPVGLREKDCREGWNALATSFK